MSSNRSIFVAGVSPRVRGSQPIAIVEPIDPLPVQVGQGRSVFDGLQRLANTETPLTTAISVAGGLLVEE